MFIKLIEEKLTVNGNRIQLFKAESCSSEIKGKTILFIGVVHGDEPEGEPLIMNLMDEISKNPEIIVNNTILFIPVLNPDGKSFGTRGNANGVDINRNFPTNNWVISDKQSIYFSGIAPASEIETQFLIKILEDYTPDIILTLHTPYRVVNYDGPATELANKISELNGYPVQKDIGYPTPGSFGTYAGIEREIPTITVELPENVEINQLWEENKQAFIYIISQLKILLL